MLERPYLMGPEKAGKVMMLIPEQRFFQNTMSTESKKPRNFQNF